MSNSKIIEEITNVIDPSIPHLDHIDATYLKVLVVGELSSRMIEIRKEQVDPDDLFDDGDTSELEYLKALTEAVEMCLALVQRDDHSIIAEDFSKLDSETMSEVRGTVGYVAPHFGIDIDFPTDGNNNHEEVD